MITTTTTTKTATIKTVICDDKKTTICAIRGRDVNDNDVDVMTTMTMTIKIAIWDDKTAIFEDKNGDLSDSRSLTQGGCDA